LELLKTTQWADFAKHGATGVPANCAGIVAGFPTAFAADDGVTAQEGGLYGMAYHIDVAAAAAFGFEATAVDDWAEVTAITQTQVYVAVSFRRDAGCDHSHWNGRQSVHTDHRT